MELRNRRIPGAQHYPLIDVHRQPLASENKFSRTAVSDPVADRMHAMHADVKTGGCLPANQYDPHKRNQGGAMHLAWGNRSGRGHASFVSSAALLLPRLQRCGPPMQSAAFFGCRYLAKVLVACSITSALAGPGYSQSSFPHYSDLLVLAPSYGTVSTSAANAMRSVELTNRLSVWNDVEDPKQPTSKPAGKFSTRVANVGDQNLLPNDPADLFGIGDFATDEILASDAAPRVELFYGARLFESHDNHKTNASGTYFSGNFFSNAQARVVLVGPETGLSATVKFGKFTFNSRASSMVGYHHLRSTNRAIISEDTAPSRVNNPLYVSPQTFQSSSDTDSVAFAGEVRLSANYWLGKSTRLNATWSNVYFNTVEIASNSVQYNLYENGNLMRFSADDPGRESRWVDTLQFSLVMTR